MKNRIRDALNRSGADYTEIRLERSVSSAVAFRGARLETATVSTDEGGFVRCLNHRHGWGMASFTGLEDLPAMVARAHELSLAVHLDAPIPLAEVPAHEVDVSLPLGGDVRGIPLDLKQRHLESLNALLLGRDRRIVDTQAAYHDEVVEYWYANSEGTLLHEVRPEVTLSALAVARDQGTVERGLESLGRRSGWDAVQGCEELFLRAADRAVGLLSAPRVRAGHYPVVLDPKLAGVFVHEAFGHLCEADVVAGSPPVRELMTPGRRIGGQALTIGDDGSAAALRGTLPFDDEGTPTRNTVLVQNGVLVGRLHTRETAAQMGAAATGNARALSFRHPPMVRMTNTYIASGVGTRDDLFRGIPLGVYACDAQGGRAHLDGFAFTAGHGYMIRDGELAEPVKDVVIAGRVFEAMERIDGIAGDFQWNEMGGGCGKGSQAPLPVAEGAPHLRIASVQVSGSAP